MTAPKLSIIVPCYKIEKYLPKCLDSLVAQTLKDIEIICVNDGSPDGCLKILNDYQKKYPHQIVVIDKENGGLWAARQSGVAIARGDYIGFIDGDDYVHKEFANKLYRAAKTDNSDIVVCGFDRVDLDTGNLYSREMCKPHKPIDIRQTPGALLEVNPAAWNKIYRADLLKNMQQLQTRPDIFEDVALQLLLYLNARKISFVPESLVYYMVRRDSMINSVKPSHVDTTFAMMQEIRNIYSREAPELLDFIDASAFLHLGVSLMYRLSTAEGVNFSEALRENTAFLDENFPRWRKTDYTKLRHVLKNHGENSKLWVVKCIYNLGLFRPFLSSYNFMFDKLGLDIKW